MNRQVQVKPQGNETVNAQLLPILTWSSPCASHFTLCENAPNTHWPGGSTPQLVRTLWRRENLPPLQGIELQFFGSLACSLVTTPVYKSTRYHIPRDKNLPFHQFQCKVTRQRTQQIQCKFSCDSIQIQVYAFDRIREFLHHLNDYQMEESLCHEVR
jgi:hypothetical protein